VDQQDRSLKAAGRALPAMSLPTLRSHTRQMRSIPSSVSGRKLFSKPESIPLIWAAPSGFLTISSTLPLFFIKPADRRDVKETG